MLFVSMAHASATILPVLRNELVAILVQMQQVKCAAARSQSITTLHHLLLAAPQLAELYSGPLLETLQHGRWTETEEAIALFALLQTIAGECSAILQPRALSFTHIAISAIKDQSSPRKRRGAVLALTDLVANTVCMKQLAPYRDDILKTLVKHLTIEQDAQAKRDVVRCLGMIGASRPYDPPILQVEPDMVSTASQSGGPSTQDILENGLIAFDQAEVWDKLPCFIADAVMVDLLAIWNDNALNHLHFAVVDAIIRIFRWELSRRRSWHHASGIIAKFTEKIADTTSDMPVTCFYISSLSYFVKEVGARMEEYTGSILPVLMHRWEFGVEPASCVVACLHALALAVRGCFKTALPIAFPKMANILSDTESREASLLAVLRFCQACAPLLKDWLHLAVPALLVCCESSFPVIQQMALDTLVILAAQVYLVPHLSRITSNLAKLARASQTGEMATKATKALCQIVKECGREGLVFTRAFQSQLGFVMHEHPDYLEHAPQAAIVFDEGFGLSVASPNTKLMPSFSYGESSPSDAIFVKLDSAGILAAFAPPPYDAPCWEGWMANLCSQTIRSTPNHHIRTCGGIADQYAPIQERLLNLAVYAAWLDLSSTDKERILGCVHQVLERTSETEGSIQDRILHLIDFMSRMGVDFAVSAQLCRQVAKQRQFLHRAMRYAELEYEDLDDPSLVAELLDINSQFKTREVDHARGLQRMAQMHDATFLDPRYLEDQDLDSWRAALLLHQEAVERDASDEEAVHGVLRCLHAQEQWDLMLQCADDNPQFPRAAKPLLVKAAWNLGQHDRMSALRDELERPDHDFYSAVLATLGDDVAAARHYLDTSRDAIVHEIVNVGATRTGRAYDCLVRTQLLMELEEA